MASTLAESITFSAIWSDAPSCAGARGDYQELKQGVRAQGLCDAGGVSSINHATCHRSPKRMFLVFPKGRRDSPPQTSSTAQSSRNLAVHDV